MEYSNSTGCALPEPLFSLRFAGVGWFEQDRLGLLS